MYSKYNRKRPKRFFLFPLIFIAAALAMGAIVMLLWNAILPPLLNINHITYWQAVGLLVLCKILFGSFGPKRYGGDHSSFRRTQWREKWGSMSDEEKMKFKDEWKKRCERRSSDES